MSRYEIAEDEWSSSQQEFAQHLRASARGKIGQPFLNLLPVPGLARKVSDLGAWLRFESALDSDIRELVTLAVAEFYRCPYEWLGHAALALKAGLDTETLCAISEGEKPKASTSAQRIALEAARSVLLSGKLDDVQFKKLSTEFGKEGALELVSLCGYYALLAMVINTGYADAEQPDWHATVETTLQATR